MEKFIDHDIKHFLFLKLQTSLTLVQLLVYDYVNGGLVVEIHYPRHVVDGFAIC